MSNSLKLADWSDPQWCLDDAHYAMDKYNMARMTSIESQLSTSSIRRVKSWIGSNSTLSCYMIIRRHPKLDLRPHKRGRRHGHYPYHWTTEYRRHTTSRSLFPLPRQRRHSVPRRDFSLARTRGCFLTESVFQTPTSRYQVGAPRARRPLAPDRTSRSRRGSALHRHRAERAALRLRRQRRPCEG